MVDKFESMREKILRVTKEAGPIIAAIGQPAMSPYMQEALRFARHKQEIIIAERAAEERLIEDIGPEEYQKISDVAEKMSVSTLELHYMVQRLNNVGINAAEAGRKLAEAMEKFRYFLVNVSYKKMLRILPKRQRKGFLQSVSKWERITNKSRYGAFFSRSGDGTVTMPPIFINQ